MKYCAFCGQEMKIDENGVAHHVKDGEVDHDQDADHVAVDEDSYGPRIGCE